MLSAGSTPTAELSAHGVVTEERPGTYLFDDRLQAALRGETPESVALMVLATVVSAGSGDGFVIDAGAKILAQDTYPLTPGHGAVVGYPDAVITRLNDHHGVVELPAGSVRPAVGSTVWVVPNHVCPVVEPRRRLRGRVRRRVLDRWRGGRARPERLTNRLARGPGQSRSRSWSTPAWVSTAATRGVRDSAGAEDHRPFAAAVDDGRRRTAVRAAAIEDQIDGVSELPEDLGGVAGLGQTRDIGGRRRERAERRGERSGSGMVRDAQADRRCAAGQRRGEWDVRPSWDDDSQAARPAALRRGPRPRRPIRPIPPAWAASSRSSMIPLSGGRRFTWNSRSMPPGVPSATAIP